MTVRGTIRPEETGLILPHEHLLVDFVGAAEITPNRYDRDEVIQVALPHLRRVMQFGCETLAECTPAYIGRDPILLRELARLSGMNLLTNTGYYGAAKNKFLPEHAFSESADRLADRWIHEAKDGIDDTGIRPGFIKIGVDAGPLSELHSKLVAAAARTHLATGLTIASHTGNGRAALDELNVLAREGVLPDAFIWVHAQNESDTEIHAKVAERGAWVEFDGVAPDSIGRHTDLVMAMRNRGLLRRTLVSHDAGWYHVGEPGGGTFRPFDTLFTEFLPRLREAGVTEAEIRQLVVQNPRDALSIRVRERDS